MTTEWKPDICIYHANCADGFGAAWAVWKRWGDAVNYVPASYGDPLLSNVYDKDVLIVDFSYKKGVMAALADLAKSVVVLDHHKSAVAELAAFRGLKDDWSYCEVGRHLGARSPSTDVDQPRGNLLVGFDMARSGAVLAWRFCHAGRPVPSLLMYVQDRDLWRFDMIASREINAFIGSLDHDFDQWSGLADSFVSSARRASAIEAGGAIMRRQAKDIDALLDASVRSMVIGGFVVPVANVPFMWASEAGNILAEGNRFAATYFDLADGTRRFSLRSTAEGIDVSEVAASYGGGGHRNAAGFSTVKGWEGDV